MTFKKKTAAEACPELSERAAEYILTRNLEDLAGLTGEKIADAFGVSLSHLTGEFKTDHNVTPDEFITREKIHTAIYILDKNREMSIEELAGKLGFPGIGRFSEAFKGYIALDPERYRQLR